MAEYVSAVLFHKIQNSDFTNMNNMKKPKTGGGQTYIQAAGYSQQEIDEMFKDAQCFDTAEFWDGNPLTPRKKYIIEAAVVGSSVVANLELAPRTGRKDYRISRQNLAHRHPAWHVSNGFPEPKKDSRGEYIYEKNYPGIIDHLYILIIKTIQGNGKVKYYATYIDSPDLPDTWPSGVGMEKIFSKSKRQGIIFLNDQYLRFTNIKDTPFSVGSATDNEIGDIALPKNINETADDPVEYASTEISLKIDISKVTIKKVDTPKSRKSTHSTSSTIVKDTDYLRRQKNLKKIGDIGEDLAVEIEKRRLINEGRSDLADKVTNDARLIGDGLGYDIRSFEKVGYDYREKYIEVKSTTGGKNKPFDISSNEVEISAQKRDRYVIYRFFGLSSSAKEICYYECRGSIKDNFTLEATAYKAYCK